MNTIEKIRTALGDEWLPTIYREKIRTQRTRSFVIGASAKERTAEVMHTLLGIELKVGRVRLSCPDLSTARYLRVFARIGCGEVAIPYDITKISTAADELESSWQRSILIVSRESTGAALSRLRSSLVRILREEISAAGAGDAVPKFRHTDA